MKYLFVFVTLFGCLKLSGQNLETVLQQGHELAVLAVAISPDSNYIATGSRDKSAKLWATTTGHEVRSFLGHELSVTAIQFTPDGKYLITGSNDKTVKIWNIQTGEEITSVLVNYHVTSLAVDPGARYVFVSGYQTEYVGRTNQWDDSVYVIGLKEKKTLKKLPANPDKGLGYGVDVAVSPDGQYLACGEDNRTAIVYRTSDWAQVNKFQYEEGFCGGCGTKVVFGPDSRSLYMASHNGPVRKYSIPAGASVKTYLDKEKTSDLTSLSISANGKLIAVSTKKKVTLLDESSGHLLDSIVAEEKKEFHQVKFSASAKQLFICSDDNTAFAWNIPEKKRARTFTGILNQRDQGGLNYDPNFYWQSAIAKYVRFKNNILISRDGKSLLKGKFGSKVKRWDIASGKTIMEYTGHKKAVLCYDLSKDGKRLVTGGGDGKIILWDFETGDSLKVISSYREPIFDIHFNGDEKKIVTSSWDATMKIHDLETGTLEHYFDFETNSAYNVRFHPNDLYVLSSRLDHSVQLWEIDTHTAVRNFIGHKDIVASMQVSADEKSLLTASWDGSIRLWDIGTGLMNRKLLDHKGAVHVALFSPDEKTLFSAGADRLVRQWDTATGKVVRTIKGHQAEITSLLISPDQKMLISHSVDGVTKFWDMTSGKEFFEHIHFGDNDWMVKNPAGYFHGTDGARQYIHFVDGLKTYQVDQFFEDFYRPELLPEIFENRGGDQMRSIQGKLQNAPPPTVRLALVPTGKDKVELFVRMTDNGNGADNLKLFHNGKSIPLDRTKLKFPSGKGQQTTYQLEVAPLGGNNIFSASATNRDRIESAAASVEYFSDLATKNSTCYLLAVGINEYKNSRMSLNYAKPDAASFVDVMNNGSQLFKNVEWHTLYDKEASKVNILKKMDELAAKINPEDVFVFYYAGHGSMVDNQFFFIPSESLHLYDLQSLKSDAIDASLLQEKLRNIQALKQLIIMDACQSGGSVELLATRGAAEEKAIAQLSRSAGIHVMASAGSEQFATEFAELGHGLFTFLLIKALGGAADGAPKDGKVTIYELKSYLDDQVPEMTRKLKGKPQYPYTFSRGQDFPVVIEK